MAEDSIKVGIDATFSAARYGALAGP
jgi:hypothetical protein